MPAPSVPRPAVTLRGAWAVGRCVMSGFRAHDGPSLAATVAYYALLSVFPLLLMTTALGAALLDRTQLQAELSRLLRTYLPPQAAAALERSVYEAVRTRGPVGAAAMALFLWSGSAATGALRQALNRVLEVQTPRPLWRRRLVDMFATLVLAGLLGASISLAVARAILLRLAPGLGAEVLRFLPGLDFFGRFGPGALAAFTFLLAYRLLPAPPLARPGGRKSLCHCPVRDRAGTGIPGRGSLPPLPGGLRVACGRHRVPPVGVPRCPGDARGGRAGSLPDLGVPWCPGRDSNPCCRLERPES